MHSVSRRFILLGGLLVVERERAVRARQLLDCGQRRECVVQRVSCWDVQRGQWVDCCKRMYGVPCGYILLGGLLVVERERAVRARQLLDCGQRRECVVQPLPWRSLLSCWVWKR
jgi:hypothetical protein